MVPTPFFPLPPSWQGWFKSNEEMKMRQDRREELQKRRQQRAKVDASPKNAVPPAKKSDERKDTAKMMKKMSKSASTSFRKGGILKMW
jgi:hypothetical protein